MHALARCVELVEGGAGKRKFDFAAFARAQLKFFEAHEGGQRSLRPTARRLDVTLGSFGYSACSQIFERGPERNRFALPDGCGTELQGSVGEF